MNSKEFMPTLEALIDKTGYGRAQTILEDFGVKYRVHHHNDHELYRGFTRDQINKLYQDRRLQVLKRYIQIFYKVKT
jgi:hypothetical protein